MKSLLAACVALIFSGGVAHAVYVVYLKNGKRVVAREKYQVKGKLAIVTLKNGSVVSLPLEQINVEKTEKINSLGLGDAELLALGEEGPPPPTPTPTPAMTTIGRLRGDIAKPTGEAAKPTPTPGIRLGDKPYPDKGVDRAFQEGLERYHLYLYRTSLGTRPQYLYVEVQVSEKEVPKALEAVCMTYHLLHQSAPERAPERVELRLLNEAGREAGVFRIAPEAAAELATGKLTPDEFFLRHVIF
ncbi:MAG: hypothetical protein NZ869_09180 [Thermoanaerobaculum sp.]|nr:hypothetical protein [Thermoanaerobaculum sp.]MDW7967442.1 hypothetical protein [Thermoanaerobaculum sp.]